MKKWIFIIIFFLVAVAAYAFLSIPDIIEINNKITVKANPDAVFRLLSKEEKWSAWWPEENYASKEKKNCLYYKDACYQLNKKGYNAFAISIIEDKRKRETILSLIPAGVETVIIRWNATWKNNENFFKKLSSYRKAQQLENNMSELLNELQTYLEQKENVYGLNIQHERVNDSVLIATRFSTKEYPTVTEIYQHIEKLRNYIDKEGATETDFPMLHVDSLGGIYNTMVALPTNRPLTGNGKGIFLRRMVLGNILVTEVKGGTTTTQKALRQMEYYINDYNLSSPAIPYESLITNRLQEPDTSKWVTKIYYPVF